MEELYPKNIIARISPDIKLSQDEIASLTQIFSLEGMKKVMETGLIEAAALIYPRNISTSKNTILSLQEAHRLITLYHAIKDKEVIASKHVKISDLIYWSTFKGEARSFIPSVSTAELLLASPEKISIFREYIQNNAEDFRVWLDLRAEILALNNLPPGRLNERRRHALEINMKLLLPQVIRPLIHVNSNEIIGNEYVSLTTYLAQQLNANVEQLEQTSKLFFTDYFKKNNKLIENPETDIIFLSKKSGKQLGKIMKIKYKDLTYNGQKEIQYFIKTHEGGSTPTSGTTHPVDFKELFIYKVLELIGHGPKVHFYFNQLSSAGFYIATQDAGFTKKQGAQHKLFAIYEDLTTEFELKEKDGFDNNTKKGILSIDIISRIFVLMDVATNSTNFGRVIVDKTRQKWKIVDFNTRAIATADTFIFEDFKRGNGTYNYTGCIGKIVRECNLDEKIALGTQVIDELEKGKPHQNGIGKKLPFANAIDQAFIFVFNYIKKYHKELKIELVTALDELKDVNEDELMAKLRLLPQNRIGELARYMLFVKQNFAMLAQDIRSYRPENLSLTSVPSSSLKPP